MRVEFFAAPFKLVERKFLMKKIIIPFLIGSLLLSTSFAYTDEESYAWARNAVNRWQTRGIISGYPDGTFRGNNYITRADLLIIANKLNNDVEKNNKRVAIDIAEYNYFFNDVCTAVNKGIIKVDDDGKIRPREYATREDAMTIFAQLFNLSYGSNAYEYLTSKFIDGNDIDYNNLKLVAGFVDAGFISGYEDGTLRPKNNVTRAEIIAMLDKIIKGVYSSGKYNDIVVDGSIIINGKDVRIKNSEIKGRVFVMEGAKEIVPVITDTNIGQGISSRIGIITVEKTDGFATLTEAENNEDNYNEQSLGYIRYDEKNWTNSDVRATLKLEDDDYEIINNSGSRYYDFTKNGEFVFECEKDGHIKKFFAEVSNIDKVVPIIKAEVVASQVNITVSDDGLSPIVRIAYEKGKLDADEAIEGTEIENNTFTVTVTGEYTIAAEDEAGNIGRLVIKVKELSETTPKDDMSKTGEDDTTKTEENVDDKTKTQDSTETNN